MRSRLIQWTSLILSALMASMMGPTSFAQTTDYPNKPIKVVVTFPPGGSSDAIIRILSTRLNDKLGHPLVLENRPGAGDLNVQQFCCEGLNFGYYYEGSPIIAHEDEPAPAYSMGSFTPSTIPGCRAPHFWLANGQSLYDLFGKGYSLLRFDASADAQELLDAAQAQGIPMTLIDLSAEPNLPEAYQHKLVLCRTDQHVVWRGDALPQEMSEFTKLLRGNCSAD